MKTLKILIVSMFIGNIVFAQILNRATADLSNITAVAQPTTKTSMSSAGIALPQAPEQYSVPYTNTFPLADGSGNTATVIVRTETITSAQLTQQLAMLNSQVSMLNQQLTDVQAQITALTAEQTAIDNLATPK